jgi:DNA-binding transcriptional MerR regulator
MITGNRQGFTETAPRCTVAARVQAGCGLHPWQVTSAGRMALDLECTLTFTIRAMTASLTIQQTADAFGLSVHTLRYYERVGLIKPVARGSNGHRLYRAEDLGWIEFLLRLRATGMSVEKMQRYAHLRETGKRLSSVSERKAMLQQHSLVVEAELKALNETLAYLHEKIVLYSRMEEELKAEESENEKH